MEKRKHNKKRTKKIITAVLCSAVLVSVLASVLCVSASAENPTVTSSSYMNFSAKKLTVTSPTDIGSYALKNEYSVYNVPQENGATIKTTTPYQGRVNSGEFLVRPTLYSGQALLDSFTAYKGSNLTTAITITGNFKAWSKMDTMNIPPDLESDTLSIAYNHTYGFITVSMAHKYIDISGTATKNYIVFQQSVNGYNSDSEKYAIEDIGLLSSTTPVNSKIVCDSPTYIPQYIKSSYDDSVVVTNPFYVFFSQTDGNWRNQSTMSIASTINSNDKSITYKLPLAQSLDTGTLDISIQLNGSLYSRDTLKNKDVSIKIRNDVGTAAFPAFNNYEGTIYYEMTIPYINKESGVFGVEKIVKYKRISHFGTLEWKDNIFNFDDEDLPEFENRDYGNYILVTDVWIDINYQSANVKDDLDFSKGNLIITITEDKNFVKGNASNYMYDVQRLATAYIQPPFTEFNFTEWIKETITGIFAVELIPAVSIATILVVIVGISLFFFMLKVFVGG